MELSLLYFYECLLYCREQTIRHNFNLGITAERIADFLFPIFYKRQNRRAKKKLIIDGGPLLRNSIQPRFPNYAKWNKFFNYITLFPPLYNIQCQKHSSYVMLAPN